MSPGERHTCPNTAPGSGDCVINEDEIDQLLDDYQLGIVDIIRTVSDMQRYEDDPERQAYLEEIQDYADAYLETFETDQRIE